MEYFFKRYFTPGEANSCLPLAKKIVKDILNLSHEIHSLAVILGEDAREHPQIETLMADLEEHLAELEELGCYYKDWNFSIGLVDFPAIIDGRTVFLCWRSDEDSVRYFHDIHAGYAGRQLIPAEYLKSEDNSDGKPFSK